MRTLVMFSVLMSGCFRSAYVEPSADDAGVDATNVAPGCECAEGPCCDGCYFRDETHACVTFGMIGPATCSGWSTHREPEGHVQIGSPLGDRYCSGASAGCDGVRVPRGAAAVVVDCGGTNYGLPGLPYVYCREDDSALGAGCYTEP